MSSEPLCSTHIGNICNLPLSLAIALPFDHTDGLSAKRRRIACDFKESKRSAETFALVGVYRNIHDPRLKFRIFCYDSFVVDHVAFEVAVPHVAILIDFDQIGRDEAGLCQFYEAALIVQFDADGC